MKDIIEENFKLIYGPKATFRDGQYDAIKSTLNNAKTLVVQKTGWGKSLVYFLSTKILRQQGKGITVVVSPLLVLMENQKEAADKFDLKSIALNSSVDEIYRNSIINDLKSNKYDLLFITPENLFKDDIRKALPNINISLFVIDEAHCISDWGHDFRLEYGKLYNVLRLLPPNVHILATTATANNRVVDDLKKQLGDNVYISRGPLTRESLSISIVQISNVAERYAWILKNINKLRGTGIIYCLTQKDCEHLASFLNAYGVKARSYYSRDEDEKNTEAINLFINNKIKVIVATIKLGMGFDKADIGFVIHYQMPSNIVAYYQQIGRAGRNISYANAILMHGNEDLDIINHFIDTAFPSKDECETIIDCLKNKSGLTKYAITNEIAAEVNLRYERIRKTLDFLYNEDAIYKDGNKYYIKPEKYEYNKKHYNDVTAVRRKERDQMCALLSTKECLSKYIVNCLDDYSAVKCKKCSNCSPNTLFEKPSQDELDRALKYINKLVIPILPRKQWPLKTLSDIHGPLRPMMKGICLSQYNDVGYGKLVKKGKYEDSFFADELVKKSAELLKDIIKEHNITQLTCIVSKRSNIVEDFTKRLSRALNITFINTLEKRDASPQKKMENSYYQCINALNSFFVKRGKYSGNVLLIDDIIDSRWTMTVCAHYLMQAGFNEVYPYALANSSHYEE